MGIAPKLAAHSSRSPDEELALEDTAERTAIFFLAGPAVDVRPNRCMGSAERKLRDDGKKGTTRSSGPRAASPHDVTSCSSPATAHTTQLTRPSIESN
jgi:hypothetical protein